MSAHTSAHPNAALLESATKGFGFLFSNDMAAARAHFDGKDDPFHLMGLGVCAFMEAVLGMEVCDLCSSSFDRALGRAGQVGTC